MVKRGKMELSNEGLEAAAKQNWIFFGKDKWEDSHSFRYATKEIIKAYLLYHNSDNNIKDYKPCPKCGDVLYCPCHIKSKWTLIEPKTDPRKDCPWKCANDSKVCLCKSNLRSKLIEAISRDQGWEESAVHMVDNVIMPILKGNAPPRPRPVFPKLIERADKWLEIFKPELPGGMITLELVLDMKKALSENVA